MKGLSNSCSRSPRRVRDSPKSKLEVFFPVFRTQNLFRRTIAVMLTFWKTSNFSKTTRSILMKLCMYVLMPIWHPRGVRDLAPKEVNLTFLWHFFGIWLFSQKLPVGIGLNSIHCFSWPIPFTWYQIYARSIPRGLAT